MSAPREIHAAAAAQLEGALGARRAGRRGRAQPGPPARRSRCGWTGGGPTCSAVARGPPRPGSPSRRPGWSTLAARRTPSAPTTCTASTSGGCSPRTGCSSRGCSATPATPSGSPATCQGVGQAPRPPRGPRRHLPAPDAAAPAARGRQRRRLRRPGLPRGPAPTSAPSTTCATWPPRCAAAGISLVLDLVLNHVAREHEWAARARAGERERTATTSTSTPTASLPDAFEQTLPEVFPDFAPGNFTWDDDLEAWVWTTFNEWQWDLNWANPDVLVEFADIICWLANLGVEVLRLDAIAFLWKRLGTACQNQPEVHAITQALRTRRPDRRAGAGVQGRGDRRAARPGAVPRHRPARRPGQRPRLPQQPDGAGLVDARHRQHGPRPARARRAARRRRPPAPGSPTSAATTTSAGRSTTATPPRSGSPGTSTGASWPTGTPASFPGSWARRAGLPAQPGHRRPADQRHRRLPGRAAEDAAPDRRPRWPGCSSRTPIVAGWGGVPVVWSGDELGQPNDPDWARRARPRGRQPLGAPAAARLGRGPPRATTCAPCPGQVFAGLAHLARVRAGLPQLHASAASRVLPDTDDGRAGHGPPAPERADGRPLQRHRAARGRSRMRPAPRGRPRRAVRRAGRVTRSTAGGDGLVWLPPYAAWWVVDGPTDAVDAA